MPLSVIKCMSHRPMSLVSVLSSSGPVQEGEMYNLQEVIVNRDPHHAILQKCQLQHIDRLWGLTLMQYVLHESRMIKPSSDVQPKSVNV